MEGTMPDERAHDFDLVLTGIDAPNREQEDALFEAGCDDATISVQSGRVCLSFSRTARSRKEAILSAIRDVHRSNVGARVLQVDDGYLVTQAEIARRIGRTRQLVCQYVAGTRGPGSFPPPTYQVPEGVALWRWSEVADWLWRNGMLGEEHMRESRDVDAINSVLDFVHHQRTDPEVVNLLFEDLKSAVPG